MIFSVPACLCTGPKWPDPCLPLWKAWTETSSGAKLCSYCTLLEFICSVSTLCMVYEVKQSVSSCGYRSVRTFDCQATREFLTMLVFEAKFSLSSCLISDKMTLPHHRGDGQASYTTLGSANLLVLNLQYCRW